MKDKNTFGKIVNDFLAGKGFYLVLFICTAVIGISAWVLFSAGSKMDLTDSSTVASTSQNGQAEVASPNSDASTDTLGRKPAVSPTPSATHETSASPAQDNSANKSSAEDGGDSETVMANPVVYVWPISGDIAVMYSVDELIYSKTMSDWRTHDGIDISAAIGTKVMAAADGTVTDVIKDDLLGTTVIIDHGNGAKSIYANLALTPVVKQGDKVAMGAVIGAVGDTALGETNEVTHLHFAMTKDDAPVDPANYLPKK